MSQAKSAAYGNTGIFLGVSHGKSIYEFEGRKIWTLKGAKKEN